MTGRSASSFTVRHQARPDGVAVVSVTGEIDLANADELRAAFSPCLGDRAVRLVICDLSGVRFLACSGLSALLDVRRALVARGARFRVVAKDPAVTRPITATGLTDTLPVSPDFATALAG